MLRIISKIFIISILISSSQVFGENFTVKTQVYCPQFLKEGKIDFMYEQSSRVQKPCKGILVQAWDSDPGRDDYCGAAYTDSRGRVSFSGSCGDGWGGGKPDIYLKIIPKSNVYSGLSVGTHHFPWYKWVQFGVGITQTISELLNPVSAGIGLAIISDSVNDWLTGNKTYKWVTSQKKGGSGWTLNWYGQTIGHSSNGYTSRMTADTYWIARDSILRIGSSGYSPMNTKFTVDFPSPFSLKLGNPSAIWRTIIMNEDLFNDNFITEARGRRAIPHELGHVLFNRYHSSWGHWAIDAVEYIQHHSACQKKSYKFAWYEGYAEFIKNYVSASQMGEPFSGEKKLC